MRLKWSEYARYKYSEQIGYIASRNPTAAAEIEATVEETLNRLLIFPRLGHIGRYPNTFECFIKKAPLIIVYEIREEIIVVLNILHTAQDYL
jgi:plasmid stabilization system protein ParE